MIRFGLPVSAAQKGNVHYCFNEDISGTIEAGPGITATEIR
jgi:hypothetical protein